MDQTYSWHSGSSVVNPKWGIPVSLFADESLSSFLLRLSHAYGLESIALGEILWPKQRVWTIDTDRMERAELVVLSQATGIDLELLYQTSLRWFELKTSNRKSNQRQGTVIPWILALGCKNRQREGGYSFCPCCWSEDSTPYLRLQWRFAWHTVCPKHRSLLADRCSQCQAPVIPHLHSADTKDMSRCSSCSFNLKEVLTEPCSQDSLDIQKLIDTAVEQGHVDLQDGRWSATELLGYLSFWESFSRRAIRYVAPTLRLVFDSLHIKLPEISEDSKGLKFEKLAVAERYTLLAGILCFLRTAPNDLYACLLDCEITRQAFVGDSKVIPPNIESIALKLADNKRSFRSSPSHSEWKPTPKYLVQRKLTELLKVYKKRKNVR